MASKLYVGNLPYSATEQSLKELFGKAGNVVSASVITDRETGRSKGFAFVEMESQADAEKAIQMFNGFTMERRELRVSIARPKEDRPAGGGYGGGYGGGGGERRGGGYGGGNRDRNRGGNSDRY